MSWNSFAYQCNLNEMMSFAINASTNTTATPFALVPFMSWPTIHRDVGRPLSNWTWIGLQPVKCDLRQFLKRVWWLYVVNLSSRWRHSDLKIYCHTREPIFLSPFVCFPLDYDNVPLFVFQVSVRSQATVRRHVRDWSVQKDTPPFLNLSSVSTRHFIYVITRRVFNAR